MLRIILTLIVFSSLKGFSQNVHDFTVTDYNNQTHSLYADYLDQGKTVVIKIFFTSCPPCQAQAPLYQSIYEDWGEGQYDVEFFELSNKTWDSNADVKNFATNFGTTMIGVGDDGGAQAALAPFIAGTYGQYYGQPSYAVIAPDRSVNWDVGISGVDAAVDATGAMGGNNVNPPTTYTLSVKDRHGNEVDFSEAQIIMGSSTDASYNLDISNFISNGNFDYPTADIPEVAQPTLKFIDERTGPHSSSALDLITIQKDILNISPFTSPYQSLAADVNNSNTLSALDLLELRKFILNITTSFPNKSLFNYYFPDCQNCQEISIPIGFGSTDIEAIRVITGDIH